MKRAYQIYILVTVRAEEEDMLKNVSSILDYIKKSPVGEDMDDSVVRFDRAF